MWKQGGFFDHQNDIDKSTWKRRGFFDQRNYIEKVKTTWKFVQIWSSTYRHNNIHVESTSIRLGVPVGLKSQGQKLEKL